RLSAWRLSAWLRLAARFVARLGTPRLAARFVTRFVARLDPTWLVTARLVTARLRPRLDDAGFFASRLDPGLLPGRQHHRPVRRIATFVGEAPLPPRM